MARQSLQYIWMYCTYARTCPTSPSNLVNEEKLCIREGQWLPGKCCSCGSMNEAYKFNCIIIALHIFACVFAFYFLAVACQPWWINVSLSGNALLQIQEGFRVSAANVICWRSWRLLDEVLPSTHCPTESHILYLYKVFLTQNEAIPFNKCKWMCQCWHENHWIYFRSYIRTADSYASRPFDPILSQTSSRHLKSQQFEITVAIKTRLTPKIYYCHINILYII